MRMRLLLGGAGILTGGLVLAILVAGSVSPIGGVARAAAKAGPTNAARPEVSGSARAGSTLTATTGRWVGTGSLSYSFQWQRCDAKGAGCTNVAGATGQTYKLASADVGSTVAVAVTAKDTTGSATAYSGLAGPVAPAGTAPAYVRQPTITGTARQGSQLTLNRGTWSGTTPITFSYEWQRCASNGKSCDIVVRTGGTHYTLGAADVGHTIVGAVIAHNGFGTQTGFTTPTGVVAANGSAPGYTTQPTISGSPSEGSLLTLHRGVWRGTPGISYRYEWLRCDSGASNCAIIGGATGSQYALTSADVGHRIVGAVIAQNSRGTQTGFTNPTAVIAAAPGLKPSARRQPAISGSSSVGGALTVTNGKWNGAGGITFAYQWLRCNTAGAACGNIGGATARSYRVAQADVGHTLVAAVTAKNRYGRATALSAHTPVVGAPPASVALPVSSIALPNRLVIAHVAFSPSILRPGTHAFVGRFRITDAAGHPVSGALVYAIGLPYGRVSNAPEVATDGSGYATITFRPKIRISPRRGYIVFFVRARKPGDSLLAGVSTRRLVQVATGR